jgi:hypothetical protein
MRFSGAIFALGGTLHLLWFALALVLGAGFLLGYTSELARADAPGSPGITAVAGVDSTTIRVTFENFADEAYGPNDCSGCAEDLHFDVRYRPQVPQNVMPPTGYTYIDGGGDFSNSPELQVISDGCLFPLWASCQGSFVEPALDATANYNVTGLRPATSYCFEVRAAANEIPLIGTSHVEYSDWSNEKCASTLPAATPTPTPLCSSGTCLIGPLPPIDLSFLGELAPKFAVIVSPAKNQVVTGDVLINVVRAQQDKDDGVFDLEWAYLAGGNWQAPAASPFLQIDKGVFSNGITLPNAVFTTTFQCGTQAAPCEFRTWRVRAHVHGVTDYQGQPIWDDWTEFRVCALPLSSSGTVCKPS